MSSSTTGYQQNDWRPIPDPTVLTTKQLRRQTKSLRELLESRIAGMERAASLYADGMNHAISDLKTLYDEKFVGIDKRFTERDLRANAINNANQLAVQTAFTTNKESSLAHHTAVTDSMRKTEEGFKDRLSSLETKIDFNKQNLDGSLYDLKDRITRLEAAALTVRETRQEGHMTVGSLVGIVGAIVGVFMLIVVLGFGLYNSSHPPANNALVGADTKRVDDLIAQSLEQSRLLNSRMDALSARFTAGVRQQTQPPPPP